MKVFTGNIAERYCFSQPSVRPFWRGRDNETSLLRFLFICLSFRYSFACLSVNGRLREHIFDGVVGGFPPMNGQYPVFCYFTHDIEDEPEPTEGWRGLGHSDFIMYNLLLLWILPPSSTTTVQVCVFLGFVATLQTAMMVAESIVFLRMDSRMPGVPMPVIFVSAYALVVDFFVQCVDLNDVRTLD